ncbi:ParB-like nuclease domain-containing protein [Dactylosporangium roseum]|uniref:ParB-like nuclease domain-containing protein n=1 Tax=Dactylosporangium roseum TaxID=47989 RepID=A0ABY5ZBU8_9ACTN|nr:ParB/RepB/Spo0J family partition protein [Dactylosporangium roseum]UWZ39593.1 ParB-like nuclease domain-containing protein [Dactylosporangium roseum]
MGQNDNDAVSLASPFGRADEDVLPIEPPPPHAAHVVLLAALRPAHSPRLVGEDPERIRLLAETEGPLPPIIVHRASMRVIDGMHRLAAARLRGQDTIDVVFFDGSDDDAFVMAVRANVAHGLPLSYADREAATTRIIETHPSWSDRAIAATTGLSARTVAGIRGRLLGPVRQTARVGRDGRVRPLDSAEGRRAAGSLLEADPNQSLRKVARAAGISPATVRDVRDRLLRGEDPVPSRRSRDQGKSTNSRSRPAEPPKDEPDPLSSSERSAVLQNLERDPSLRFAESGRGVLRWLYQRVIAEEEWQDVAAAVPPHSGYIMAGLARRCANEWLEFAKQLEDKLHPRT